MPDMDEDLEAFARAQTSLELKRALAVSLARQGYDNFQLLRYDGGLLADVIWSEMPPGLNNGLSGRKWVDPFAPFVLALDGAQIWASAIASHRLSPADRQFVLMAADFGMHDAVIVPVHGANQITDCLHVSRRSAVAAKAGLPAQWRLAALAFVVCARLRQIDHRICSREETSALLSPRELEVLRWCKDGKSYSEIGTIMGVSSKTVEFHISNVMRKLGVNQKITAIVAAAKQGLIQL